MELDPHSYGDGFYHVRSHYFDSPDLCCYEEKLGSMRRRHKFRLRSYSRLPGYHHPLFLELKGRDEALVYKHRMLLPHDQVGEAVSRGPAGLADYMLARDELNGTGRRFVFDLFRKRLVPTVVVHYCRTAFENRCNPDFRATFDFDIAAFTAGPDGLAIGGGHELAPGYSVLEIKFRYHLPAWFHRLIQVRNLQRISFSKFAHGTTRACLGLRFGASPYRYFERKIGCL